MGDRPRRHAVVHRLVRPEQRSDGAADLRQRRVRHRRDALGAAASTRRSWRATCRARCPAAARTWSRASTAAGTSCARCPRARSRGCASSCCSPTARPTACRATGTGPASRSRSAPTTSRRIFPTPTARRGTTRRSAGSTTRRAATRRPASASPPSNWTRCRRTIADAAVHAGHDPAHAPPQRGDPDVVSAADRRRSTSTARRRARGAACAT